jgi:hypothetical protein
VLKNWLINTNNKKDSRSEIAKEHIPRAFTLQPRNMFFCS